MENWESKEGKPYINDKEMKIWKGMKDLRKERCGANKEHN